MKRGSDERKDRGLNAKKGNKMERPVAGSDPSNIRAELVIK